MKITHDTNRKIRISLINQEEIDKQREAILHHIIAENVLKCNTYNLQNIYINVTGTVLHLNLHHQTYDDKYGKKHVIVARTEDGDVFRESSLKELLNKCNLRIHMILNREKI